MIKRNPKVSLKSFRLMIVCLIIFITFIIVSSYSMITSTMLMGGETSEYIAIVIYDLVVIWLSSYLIKNMFIFQKV